RMAETFVDAGLRVRWALAVWLAEGDRRDGLPGWHVTAGPTPSRVLQTLIERPVAQRRLGFRRDVPLTGCDVGVDGGDGLVGSRAAFCGGEFPVLGPEFVVNPDVAQRLERVLSLGYVTAGPPGVDPVPERGPDFFAHVAAVLVGQSFKGGLAV